MLCVRPWGRTSGCRRGGGPLLWAHVLGAAAAPTHPRSAGLFVPTAGPGATHLRVSGPWTSGCRGRGCVDLLCPGLAGGPGACAPIVGCRFCSAAPVGVRGSGRTQGPCPTHGGCSASGASCGRFPRHNLYRGPKSIKGRDVCYPLRSCLPRDMQVLGVCLHGKTGLLCTDTRDEATCSHQTAGPLCLNSPWCLSGSFLQPGLASRSLACVGFFGGEGLATGGGGVSSLRRNVMAGRSGPRPLPAC